MDDYYGETGFKFERVTSDGTSTRVLNNPFLSRKELLEEFELFLEGIYGPKKEDN